MCPAVLIGITGCEKVIPGDDEKEAAVSEAVERAVNGVAARVSAAAGVEHENVSARVRMSGVTPEDVSRRILLGLVDLEDMDGLLQHVEVRVDALMDSLMSLPDDEQGWYRRGATIFMSEVQCIAVGMALAREEKSLAPPVEEEVQADVGVGPPAHASFSRSSAYRPSHGGRPGSASHPDGWC